MPVEIKPTVLAEKDVLIFRFDRKPDRSEVAQLVEALPDLKKFDKKFIGIFDLDGNDPASAFDVFSSAPELSAYKRLLENVLLVNAPKDDFVLSVIARQIGLFIGVGFQVLTVGDQEETAANIAAIKRKNKTAAEILQAYLLGSEAAHTLINNMSD